MSVKLELYRVFKEVAEVGNITAAAQALYISQSAVSQSIKQLERDLQTRLFARNSRGVSLTAEGQMLYEYVRSAMGLLETGEEKLSQTRELQMGQLTIGASDTVTSQFLLPYLDEFHKEHPAIHIQIISGRSHKVLGLLRSGKVDIAFASTPSDTSSLLLYPCFDTHAIFVAGADPSGQTPPSRRPRRSRWPPDPPADSGRPARSPGSASARSAERTAPDTGGWTPCAPAGSAGTRRSPPMYRCGRSRRGTAACFHRVLKIR